MRGKQDNVEGRSADGILGLSLSAATTTTVVTAALWVVAIAMVAVLIRQRYRDGIGADPFGPGSNVDLGAFLAAAHSVAEGGSPYTGSAHYIYFAPLSLVLSLASHVDRVDVLRVWTAAGIGAVVVAVGLLLRALRSRVGAPWQVPVLFALCCGIGLHIWPMTYEFFLGNDDAFVLLGVVVAGLVWSAHRPVWFGVVLGLVCLIKVWPVVLVLAVLQQGVDTRRRALAVSALVGTIVVGLATNLVPAGIGEFSSFLHAVFAAKSQHLVSDSVTGIPKLLFSRTGLAVPLVVSTGLRDLLTMVLLACVVGLLVVCLSTRGEPMLCVFNTTIFVVLVDPVSHMVYSILALPVVWFWLANYRVFLRPGIRSGPSLTVKVGVALTVLLWCAIQVKAWPGDGSPASLSSIRLVVIFAANLALFTASVVGGRTLMRPARADRFAHAGGADGPEAPPAETGPVRVRITAVTPPLQRGAEQEPTVPLTS